VTYHVADLPAMAVARDADGYLVTWLGKEIMLRPSEVIDRIARALAC
jgi:hypothetical protein